MSESIDRRVVEMRFDNKDFENNVNTTMTVLEKLKEKLSFKGAGEKFESTSGLSSAIDGVKSRFSALEVVGMTALINLTNSAVNLGKQMAKSLTIDQVKAGFSEYELKMGSIQTIMASTGADIETVNKKLNELNTYSDKTIYSFSDMTSSIGKFTNAGVDLNTAVAAIQGISNEAAVSGANAQEASRAMYNFAQALSAGYVKLIDWKSIENANMATKEFKQQLIDTAVAEGNLEKQADGTYKVLTQGANGAYKDSITATKNFNDSLSAAWMTTDVLTKTLGRYADESTDIGKKAFAAAQDVKTFSQLMDTVKESIGSGWAQTFENIFGNLEEAKELWTGVNTVISGFISRSADARNALLQAWHDSPRGRDAMITGFQNLYKAVSAIVKPIHEAFRNIFPPTTVNQLLNFSTQFRALTSHMIIGEGTAHRLRSIFRLLFLVLKGGIGIVSNLAKVALNIGKIILPIGNAILGILANISSSILRIYNGVNSNSGVTNWFADLAEASDIASEKIGNLASGAISKLGSILSKVGPAIGKFFALLGKGLSNLNLAKVGGLLAGGGIFAAFMKLRSLFSSIQETFEGLFGGDGEKKGLKEAISDTFESLSDTLNQFQASLKVGQLVTVAIALGILAASCATLADIPAKKLAVSVAAIGGLFTELGIASHLMSGAETKGIITMSIAVLLLAKAVKSLSEVESMGKGLLGVGALLGELTAFCLIFDRLKIKPESLAKTSMGLILMAVAINMLAKPVKELGAMDVGSLIKGLTAVAAMLTGFTLTAKAFTKIETTGLVKAGAAMVLMAVAIRMLAKPLAQLGGMDMKSLAKGLGGMAVALGEFVGFTVVMGLVAKSSGNIMKASAALLVMSVGIKIMAGAISQMGADAGAGQGLSVMFGALIILAGAMALMQKSLPGAAAMIVVAGALAVMAPAIALLSSLNFKGVVTGLVALAGTLAVFGVGAALLTPLIPVMIALAAAMALLGVGVLSLGAGMTLLVAAFSMATGPIVQGATAIAQAFPIIAKGIGEGIVTIIQTIGDSAEAIKIAFMQIIDVLLSVLLIAVPRIANVGLKLILALLMGINQNIKQITKTAVNVIANFIDGLAEGMPRLVESGFNLMISFLNSMADAISNNGDALAIAFTDVLLAALGAVVGLIPGFGKQAKKAIDNYRDGLKSGKDSTAKAAKSVANTASTNMKIKDQKSNGSSAVRSIKHGIDSLNGQIRTSSKSIANTANSNLKVKDQKSNGANAVRGLKQGMESMKSSLRTAANSIADIVDKAIRKKNQMHSPSRRLARTGRQLMEGLIIGVDSLSGQYQRKADNIATTMISSATRSANAVSNIMNSSFSDGFDLNSTVNKAIDVSVSMDKLNDRNSELNSKLEKLAGSLDTMTESMNSRSLNVYNTIDGSSDPEAFADGLIRSFRLNARAV